jgi:hypothetical protein
MDSCVIKPAPLLALQPGCPHPNTSSPGMFSPEAKLFVSVMSPSHGRVYAGLDAPLHDKNGLALTHDQFVTRIKSVSHMFSDQKIAVKGACEKVGQRPTTLDDFLCPMKALGCIIYHLRKHNTSPITPLYMFYNNHPSVNEWFAIKPTFVTNALHYAC